MSRIALSAQFGARGPIAASLRRNVLDELEQRGFVAAVTSPQLRAHLASPSCVYVGVDPSASSLHVGNLLPLLGLLHFRSHGHRTLAVIGGATGSIGDPSGRSTERNALSSAELTHNVAGITAQVKRFFERGADYATTRGYDLGYDSKTAKGKERERGMSNDEDPGYEVLNNFDWFKDISFLDFLRDVGKLARVNVMLARDSVKNRLSSEQGISFTEFSYQLLQAHDFATLYRSHGCRIQMGGSDQWGNIVAGIDMIKRVRAAEAASGAAVNSGDTDTGDALEPVSAFGLTMPLLTTSSGEKFGKSAGNAIWLDEQRTTISDFYQFFYRSTDADVRQYLSLLTLVSPETIAQVMADHKREPSKRAPQRLLAREITELVHGASAVKRAETIALVLFSSTPRELRARDVLDAFDSDPRLVRVHRRDIKDVPVSKLAVLHGLCKSRGEASRIISSGGMSVNDLRVNDPRREISRSDWIDGHIVILRRGARDAIVFYVDTD